MANKRAPVYDARADYLRALLLNPTDNRSVIKSRCESIVLRSQRSMPRDGSLTPLLAALLKPPIDEQDG